MRVSSVGCHGRGDGFGESVDVNDELSLSIVIAVGKIDGG